MSSADSSSGQKQRVIEPSSSGTSTTSARRHVGELGPAALVGQPGQAQAQRVDGEQQPAARAQHRGAAARRSPPPRGTSTARATRRAPRSTLRVGQPGQRPAVGAAPAAPAPGRRRRRVGVAGALADEHDLVPGRRRARRRSRPAPDRSSTRAGPVRQPRGELRGGDLVVEQPVRRAAAPGRASARTGRAARSRATGSGVRTRPSYPSVQ